MSVLISGASGFIGSHVAEHLKTLGNDVINIQRDNVTSSSLERLGVKLTTVKGDLLDSKLVLRTVTDYDVDTILHFAAESIVKRALIQPGHTFDVNVGGTVNLLEAARLRNVKHFLLYSTDKVLGNALIPTNETVTPNPTAPYETSKYASELAVNCYNKTFGLNTTITRSCNVYGEFDLNSRIISNTIRDCLLNKPPVIFNNVTAKREYIYVKDVANVIEHLLKNRILGLYHIGTGEVFNQEQVVLEILKHFPQLKPIYKDPEAYSKHEIQDQCLDSTKLRTTGWAPKVTFEDGIKRTLDAERKSR